MENDNFQVNRQFAMFKGKEVVIGLKNRDELEGEVVAIDNFLNTVVKVRLEDDSEAMQVIKGGKIVFISVKNS